jgi:hypothetical protein
MPSLISGWPKTADSAAIRKLHAIASSQPPPKASELTAATVETRLSPIERSSAWPESISSRPPASSIDVNALMSAPAENTTGFDDATTSARISPPAVTLSQTVPRSLITCGEIAFIGGFASHAIATSPRVSSFTVSV